MGSGSGLVWSGLAGLVQLELAKARSGGQGIGQNRAE